MGVVYFGQFGGIYRLTEFLVPIPYSSLQQMRGISFGPSLDWSHQQFDSFLTLLAKKYVSPSENIVFNQYFAQT